MSTQERNEIRKEAEVMEAIHWNVLHVADNELEKLTPQQQAKVKQLLEVFSRTAWNEHLDLLDSIDELTPTAI